MVGSGASDRSKEAVGMMALHEALRGVCLNTDWTYAVFWTIRPRPRVRGGNVCKVGGEDNGSLMLMWEDGFCRGMEDFDGDDPVRRAFSKMSIQLYNYGEGLMGKVASDKCHKWVFSESSECEPNISNYWQSSFDAIPPEWTDQFDSGIQTIAVIQAGHGLLQLGSCKIIPEDLHFVLRMRHTFESLGYQSGYYLTHLFSSASGNPPSLKQSYPPPSSFSWGHRPPSVAATPAPGLGLPTAREEPPHVFLYPHPEPQMEGMAGDTEPADMKWADAGLSSTALTRRAEDAKFLFSSGGHGNGRPAQGHHPVFLEGRPSHGFNPEALSLHVSSGWGGGSPTSLGGAGKMESKFRRNFTLPARLASSSSSTSVYPDVLKTFME